jgi:ABC-2 type transport system ATP-binding protein
MVTKLVECPSCKGKITVEGDPGQKIIITCPNCNTKGVFIFPQITIPEPVTKSGSFALEVNGLTKTYKDLKAVDNLSFNIRVGEIFGLLGPNGAGKTTTIRTLLGYLHPTLGTASIFGKDIKKDIKEIKREVGYIPGDLNIYGHQTGRQFLDYFAALRNREMILLDELLEIFDVPLDKKLKGYSKGMKQKIGIIQAFMDDPDMVIMDEPTSGLDPLLQQKFYDFLMEQKKKGKTMFLSSHILSEVDRVCDRVGIIKEGKLIALEDVETLKSKRGKIIRLKIKEDPETFKGPNDMKIEDGWIEFVALDDIGLWVKKFSEYTVLDLVINDFSLEDIFIHYYEG